MAPCVEFKTFRVNYEEHPGLIPIGVDGEPIRYGTRVQGICLSQPDYLEETEGSLREGMRLHEPVGVWLDYLTYAGWFETPEPDLQESCFCPACVKEFCESENVDACAPGEILRGHQKLWTGHKCRRVAGLASRYASVIREARAGCLVGAYMCPYTPVEYDGALSRIFAQDYRLFSPAIDVFTPLIYARKSGRRDDWGRRLLESSPGFVPANRKVQLILDCLDFPGGLQAAAASGIPTWGFQLFAGGILFHDPARRNIFRTAVDMIKARIEENA